MYGVYIYIHTYTNLYHYIEDFCSFMQAWCSAYRHPFYNRSIDFIKLVDFPDCVGRFWKIFLQRKDLELVIRSPASRFCDGGPWPRVWSSVRLTCLALSCVLSGAMHRGMQLQFVFRSNHTTIAPATQPEADQSLRHRDVCRFVLGICRICPCPACRMFQCNKSLVWRSGMARPQVCILLQMLNATQDLSEYGAARWTQTDIAFLQALLHTWSFERLHVCEHLTPTHSL